MELIVIYVTVVGAANGILLRYVLPGRHAYGIVLLPAVGADAAAAIWVGMLWAGFRLEDPLFLWLGALGGALLLSLVVALVVSRVRLAADERQRHVLSGGKA